MMKSQNKPWTLFFSMLMISAFTFGGGFVIVSLMKKKFVDELDWLTEEEMLDMTALAQSAPGPIAVNAAILVGRRVAGLPGMMAAVMGIDQSLFEAADIDGANGWQSFTRVTMPLIRPVLSYTLITSLIGGLQMYDVPQVLTNGGNVANRSCMTIIMLLNNYIGKSKNYGYGGALSVLLFIVTAVLGLFVYWSLNTNEREAKKLAKEQKRKMAQMRKGGELA